MSDGFSAEVDALRRGANLFLGAAIDDLSTAKSEFGSTKDHVYAFEGGDNLFSEVRNSWEEMGHYFDRVFNDNIENLNLTREALLEIANRYEEVDNESTRAVQA